MLQTVSYIIISSMFTFTHPGSRCREQEAAVVPKTEANQEVPHVSLPYMDTAVDVGYKKISFFDRNTVEKVESPVSDIILTH